MATVTSRRSAVRPRPFTVDHFRLYARRLILDSREPWEPEDWQLSVVEDLFSGVQQVWLIVPQGNGKTTLVGGIALYHADFTPAPWVPVAASSSKQARILFGQAAGFVERTEGLAQRFTVQPGYPRILSKVNGGEGIQVYAADKNTGEGIIPTLCLVDEPHVQKDLGLYRTWRGKLRKRKGQIMAISTAGEPGTDFEETRDKIRENAEGREQRGPCYFHYRSPRLVMHEFRVPKMEQVRDLRVVKAANPLSIVTEDELAELLEDDTLDWGEDWLRKTCNIPARSSRAAISEVDWDDAQVDDEIPAGEPVWVGADFAWTLDTTALVPLWMRDEHYRLLGPATILVPPGDGRMLESQDVKDAFNELNDRNPIEAVVMDMSKAEDTAQWLENDLGVEVVDRTYRGEAKFAIEDFDMFTEALREGWLKHTGDPGLRRHVMNAIARKVPGDKYRFDRPSTSRTSRRLQEVRVIDALSAASMVHTTAAQNLRREDAWVEVIA